MKHPQHRAFVSLLSRWSTSEGIKYKTALADRLGVPPRQIHQWMFKGVMPKKGNLQVIADATGNVEFANLR